MAHLRGFLAGGMPSFIFLMLISNIIHRLDGRVASREALGFQWGEARRLGLPTTTLLTYPTLFDPVALADAGRWIGPGDELGLHFHEIKCNRVLDRFGVREPMLWLWPREKRIALIDEMVTEFTKIFGKPPASVGGYVIDAWTLREIERRHPSIRTAITSCFEEGVKMYYGNNRNWLLFSDGGPWNPYFPSRENALAPAANTEDAIDIVAVPHLNRDMIMALSSRDDWFASHPGNVFRARINEGAKCPYLFRFYQAWEHQAELNGWSYLNIFVSSPWLLGSHWCIDREEDVRALYTETLEYLKGREEAGALQVATMNEFGREFRQRVQPGDATICHWRDELGQSKREVVWLSNAHHRSTLDMARGGALVDFRPYDGRLNLDLGPESQGLWNGNAPFLVSTEHNGGHWNTSQHATVTNGQHTVSLCDRRLRADVEWTGECSWIVRGEPTRFDLGGNALVVESEWELNASEMIAIRRRVLEYQGDLSTLRLSEIFLGRAGTTEYPEDQRETRLRSPHTELQVSYSGTSQEIDGAKWVEAMIPRLGISLRLSAQVPALRGTLADGLLFSPSFRLQLDYDFSNPTVTCLITRPLKSR